jgi:hypothetical protein
MFSNGCLLADRVIHEHVSNREAMRWPHVMNAMRALLAALRVLNCGDDSSKPRCELPDIAGHYREAAGISAT